MRIPVMSVLKTLLRTRFYGGGRMKHDVFGVREIPKKKNHRIHSPNVSELPF